MAPIRINSKTISYVFAAIIATASGADAQQPLRSFTRSIAALALPRAQTENSTASAHTAAGRASRSGWINRLPQRPRVDVLAEHADPWLHDREQGAGNVESTGRHSARHRQPVVAGDSGRRPCSVGERTDSRGAADRDPRHIDLAQHARLGVACFDWKTVNTNRASVRLP